MKIELPDIVDLGHGDQFPDGAAVDPADDRGNGGGDTGIPEMPQGGQCPYLAAGDTAEAIVDFGQMAVDADAHLGESGLLERPGLVPVNQPTVAVHGDPQAETTGKRC